MSSADAGSSGIYESWRLNNGDSTNSKSDNDLMRTRPEDLLCLKLILETAHNEMEIIYNRPLRKEGEYNNHQ